jgi:hypothetical protein
VGVVDKGAGFALNFGGDEGLPPANEYACAAIAAFFFENVRDERVFFPKHGEFIFRVCILPIYKDRWVGGLF